MPEGVVDRAEVVDVEHEDGECPVVREATHRLVDIVGEPASVGEAGQRVVERLVREADVEPPLLGDIVAGDDDAADRKLGDAVA